MKKIIEEKKKNNDDDSFYRIIYMGSYNDRIFELVTSFKRVRIVGGIIDYYKSEELVRTTKEKFENYHIPEVSLDDINSINPDLVFLCSYSRILQSSLIEKYIFVNIHAGILPKWRGKNANCWAILNGESRIGYTIHRVNPKLDDGGIYKIVEINMEENESYYSARERLKDKLDSCLEDLFLGIISGNIVEAEQKREEVIYNVSLKPKDGNIYDWNKPASYIHGLFKVFGTEPYGTGVRFFVRGKSYSVLDMTIAHEIGVSTGIAGSVIFKDTEGYSYIKVLDKAVKIGSIMDEESNIYSSTKILKLGMRL